MAVFPQLEILVGSLLLNPYSKEAGRLFKEGTVQGILAGLGMLLALPLPLLSLGVYVIWKYVMRDKEVKFVVLKPLEIVHGPWEFLKRSLLGSNLGFWTDKNQLVDRFGYFFKNVRGPIYQFVGNDIRWDHNSNSYKWGRVYLVPEGLAGFRAYYGVFFIFRNMLLSIILLAFPPSEGGSIAQLVLLSVLLGIHAYYMVLLVAPFNDRKMQMTNVGSSVCEFGMYISGILLVIYGLEVFERMIFGFQMAGILVQILSQLWGVGVMVIVMGWGMYNRLRYGEYGKWQIEQILGRRYFEKWKRKVIKVEVTG